MKICTLASGSSGNAIYIEAGNKKVLVDVGISGKSMAKALEDQVGICPTELDAILVTHEHKDHVKGVGIVSRRYDVPIYATEGTWLGMEDCLGKIAEHNRRYLKADDCLELGELKIEACPISHDANDPVGYCFHEKNKSGGVVTDSGIFTARMEEAYKQADCLVIEANHDPKLLATGKYPVYLKKRVASSVGHLSNYAAGHALSRVISDKTKKIILAHLSEENNTPQLALDTIRDILNNKGINLDDQSLTVAPRYQAGKCNEL